jgi:hypothetical protein
MAPTVNGTHDAGPLGRPTRLVVLGYYDGFTSGLIQFDSPAGPTFAFEMPDEDGQLGRAPRGPREYTFSPLPADAIDRVVAALPHHPPTWPVWTVSWQFPSAEDERAADERLAAILAEAGPPRWLVSLPAKWSVEAFRPLTVKAPQPA